MGDEQSNTPEIENNVEFYQSDPAIIAIEDTLDSFLSAATVEAVFGEPVEHGDALIIPMAEILSGVGFGMGYYSGGANYDDEDEPDQTSNRGTGAGGTGGGGGGGGRVLSRPVGVIIASQEGIRVEPVVDVTKIALAALTAAGFMTAMMMRMANPRKALKSLKPD
jgi:uncharacterized spore protein YtfJ